MLTGRYRVNMDKYWASTIYFTCCMTSRPAWNTWQTNDTFTPSV